MRWMQSVEADWHFEGFLGKSQAVLLAAPWFQQLCEIGRTIERILTKPVTCIKIELRTW